MKNVLLFLALVLFATGIFAQRPQQGSPDRRQQQVVVHGIIIDQANKQPLPGAHITLTNMRDTTKVFHKASDEKGVFRFEIQRGGYKFKASFLGYQPNEQTIRAIEEVNDLGQILLSTAGAMLDEVTVTGKAVAVRQKGDTIQFQAQAYKTNPDASSEDLIKKMPGITVDTEGVKAQGETVKRVLVDGQVFFGDDPNIALRNLPADMVDRVEVFDQLSDQAQLTGFDDGEKVKTINIITRLDRKSGQFGRVFSGYGDENRYQGGLVTNIFMNKRRISIIGMSNNINQQNFSSEDLSGFMSSSSRGGGMPGGMRGQGGMSSGGGMPNFNRGDFIVGQQSGNNTTHSLGINYTDVWGEKVNVNGSYFFNLASNNSEQLSNREYLLDGLATQYYSASDTSKRNNYNHRFNARIDWRINPNHTIMITPRFSFQKTESDNISNAMNFLTGDQVLNKSVTAYNRDWDGYSVSNAIIYRAKINDAGRSISARANINLNNNEYLYFLDALSSYYDGPVLTDDLIDQKSTTKTDSYGLSSNLTYTEPIGKKGMLQLAYNLSYSDNASDRMTNSWDILRQAYTLLEEDLSSELTNGYVTNRLGLGYRLRGEKSSLMAEVSYQHSSLNSNQVTPYIANVNHSFQNWVPMLQYSYNFSKTKSLRIMYRNSTNAPSVNQLQDVLNNSNPLQLSSGNPNLEQSNTHFFTANYRLTEVAKARSLFLNIFGNITSDFIGNSTIIAKQDMVLDNGLALPRGAQFTRPENMDGYANIRSMLTYGFPLTFIKSNINLTGGVAYSQTPTKINEVKSVSQTYNTNGGIVLSSNISTNVDFTLSYRLNYNISENSIRPQLNSSYFYHVSEVRFNWIFLKGWVLRNDVSNLYYAGLGEDFNENYWLWNVNLGRKIFANKRGEITLGVYDLLNQNRSVNRIVTDTYIEDVRSNVLNRFFMLTFTYNMKNFTMAGQKGI